MIKKTPNLKMVGVLVLIGIAVFVSIKSLGNSGLDTFAQKYSSFKDQQFETLIQSLVPIVDNSEESGEENYFSYLEAALDLTKANRSRKDAAQQALYSYSLVSERMLNDFDSSIRILGSRTLDLIEAANGIKNKDYRLSANEIAKKAREIQQGYQALSEKYYERFTVQRDFLGKLIENEGDLLSLGFELQEAGGKVPELSEEIDVIEDIIKKANDSMGDEYYALKGRAVLKDYPNKFTKD